MTPDSKAADALRIWFRLLRLETSIRTAMGDRLRKLDLSVPQLDVLTTLTEQEGMSQQELAARLYVTKGNISGLLDRMVIAGLVQRRVIATDRRSHAIHLTDEGRTLAARGIAIQTQFVSDTVGRLEDSQLAGFETLILATREFVRETAGRKK